MIPERVGGSAVPSGRPLPPRRILSLGQFLEEKRKKTIAVNRMQWSFCSIEKDTQLIGV